MYQKEETFHTSLDYQQPDMEIIEIKAVSVLCESPLPGENESVNFVDWN